MYWIKGPAVGLELDTKSENGVREITLNGTVTVRYRKTFAEYSGFYKVAYAKGPHPNDDSVFIAIALDRMRLEFSYEEFVETLGLHPQQAARILAPETLWPKIQQEYHKVKRMYEQSGPLFLVEAYPWTGVAYQ